jgi:hypothetical protein
MFRYLQKVEMDATYECPIHKITHIGIKRETFEKDHFEALLNASMKDSYQLYKQVKHGCHCPSNYAAFDSLTGSLPAEKEASLKESPPTKE